MTPGIGFLTLLTIRRIWLYPVALLILLVLFEIFLRIQQLPEIRGEMLDKQLHCVEPDGVFVELCPDTRVTMKHPSGYSYTVTVDSYGHRKTPAPGDKDTGYRSGKSIWFLGDSIAMGYGLNDDRTIPAVYARLTSCRVRNLGVDSMGVLGIHAGLKRSLKQYPEDGDIYPVWIFHPSDFLDDQRDALRRSSYARRQVLKSRFFLTRNFALFAWTNATLRRFSSKQAKPSVSSMDIRNQYDMTFDDKHTGDLTFRALEEMMKTLQNRNLPLIVVFYPDQFNGKTPFFDRFSHNLIEDFMQKRNVIILKLYEDFLQHPHPETLYIPDDGHPTPGGAELIARGIKKYTGSCDLKNEL